MSRASALLVTAALLGGCSSSGAASSAKATDQVLTGTPAKGTTACSALSRSVVERLYAAAVTKTSESSSPRRTQTLQTGCVFDLKGERATTLGVHLWFGEKFKDQWGDEVNAAGTTGFKEQPYGVEAYGIVTGNATELDIAERHFAVRLVCGPRPSSPEKPLGLDACAGLASALNDAFGR